MRKLVSKFIPLADIIITPVVYLSALLLKKLRKSGFQRKPYSKKALLNAGVFPILNHYYEPQFDFRQSGRPLSENRNLPGVDMNTAEQLSILSSFSFSAELLNIPKQKTDKLEYYLHNDSFISGDAEYWYQVIRKFKPRRIIEVGSGYSTLMAIKAIQKNREQDGSYDCELTCIEPYEMPWLEKTGAVIVRRKIEEIELSFFASLEENDILFIDSSHVIRPQGDVLFEFLELLPTLKKGVIVHIHDIFTPRNYLRQWVEDEVKFWNEQYLLEAFLSHNNAWKIIGALNYLHHNYFNELKSAAPFLTPEREPGSFYIRKIM